MGASAEAGLGLDSVVTLDERKGTLSKHNDLNPDSKRVVQRAGSRGVRSVSRETQGPGGSRSTIHDTRRTLKGPGPVWTKRHLEN